MASALLDIVLDRVKRDYELAEPLWDNIDISEADIQFLEGECLKESEFDPTNKRNKMFNGMSNGSMYTVMAKCAYGSLLAVFEDPTQIGEMPWGVWARILRMFSEPDRKPFKVFFLAHKSLREFPPGKKPITPENINGGYTYRCDPETIVIYRAEDATRVLIHELQHSCCLDRVENGLDMIEAETEAWAELFYQAILSRGQKYMFKDLIRRQSEWMRKQNAKVRQHMKGPTDFPWRYTIGKQEVWERWGILSHEDLKPEIKEVDSLRLTYPPQKILKDRFKVHAGSTIL
jgi:hypothetical protein